MTLCVSCDSWESKVVDSRKKTDAGWVVRRRECAACGTRWTTYEVPANDVRHEAEEVSPASPRSTPLLDGSTASNSGESDGR